MLEDTERNLNTDPSIEKEETTMKGGDAPETPSPEPGHTSATPEPAEEESAGAATPAEEAEPVPVDLTELRPTEKEAAPEPETEPEAEPEPFVHQLELQDAYVQYELNATTHRVKEMTRIYSDLHQHIQDRFHEAGVEIASPHFLALRDGNRMSIPDEYLPKDYEAPVLRIGPLEWRGQGGRGGG